MTTTAPDTAVLVTSGASVIQRQGGSGASFEEDRGPTWTATLPRSPPPVVLAERNIHTINPNPPRVLKFYLLYKWINQI